VKLITAAVAAAALLCAFAAPAAIKSTKVDAPTVVLKRGSTTITPAPLDMVECEARKVALMALDGESKQSGSGVYDCLYIQRTRVAFGKNPPPPPSCTVPRPAVEGRSMQCPPDSVGTWTQTREYVPAAYPVCWTPAEWTPTNAPPGICAIPYRATISWTPPTQNTDGTSLTNLAGYRIEYGTSASALSRTVDVPNASVSSYVIEQLSPATWFFAVRAYTTGGIESVRSNIASKTLP